MAKSDPAKIKKVFFSFPFGSNWFEEAKLWKKWESRRQDLELVSAIAQYLGCADNVPLNQRVSEFERRLREIENLVKVRK